MFRKLALVLVAAAALGCCHGADFASARGFGGFHGHHGYNGYGYGGYRHSGWGYGPGWCYWHPYVCYQQ